MSTNELLSVDYQASARRISEGKSAPRNAIGVDRIVSYHTEALSPWTRSQAKRVFDVVCVLCSLPVVIPIMIAVGLIVRCTSKGPALFRQERMGRDGRAFQILKFRTMVHSPVAVGCLLTTSSDQRFTAVGPLLRRWKLDEIPQLLNVLWGDMSLVGPRPKVCEHEPVGLQCRPGITGAATIAFAREEMTLDCIPRHELKEYYCEVVLPVKRKIDGEYMARASFRTDFALLCNSLLGRWEGWRMQSALQEHNEQISTLQDELPVGVCQLAYKSPADLRGMEVSTVEGDSA